MQTELGRLPFIAEDLGLITPDVQALRDEFQVPGTRVLQFAFDGHADNPYLPHNFVSNTVVYTGTHDNATTRQWYEELADDQRQNVWSYLKRAQGESAEVAPALMGLAWSSVAALAIAPLQDLLNLGRGTRMNVPGRADGNWRWRCSENMLFLPAFQWLRDLTESSKRSGGPGFREQARCSRRFREMRAPKKALINPDAINGDSSYFSRFSLISAVSRIRYYGRPACGKTRFIGSSKFN